MALILQRTYDVPELELDCGLRISLRVAYATPEEVALALEAIRLVWLSLDAPPWAFALYLGRGLMRTYPQPKEESSHTYAYYAGDTTSRLPAMICDLDILKRFRVSTRGFGADLGIVLAHETTHAIQQARAAAAGNLESFVCDADHPDYVYDDDPDEREAMSVMRYMFEALGPTSDPTHEMAMRFRGLGYDETIHAIRRLGPTTPGTLPLGWSDKQLARFWSMLGPRATLVPANAPLSVPLLLRHGTTNPAVQMTTRTIAREASVLFREAWRLWAPRWLQRH